MDPPYMPAGRNSFMWSWTRAALIAVVLVVFSPLFTAEFVSWDDPHTVAANPALLPPTWAGVIDYWRPLEPAGSDSDHPINHQFGLWIPLTYTAWSAIALAAQVENPLLAQTELNPYVFHVASLIVHAGTVLCVLAILRRALRSKQVYPAAAGALLFALHPVQVEAVAWVSGLKDLLAGFFACGMILAYLLHADETRPPARRRTFWWMAAGLLVLALLCKPSAVVAPALAAAIDWLLLRRRWRTVLLGVAPLAAIALPFAIIARLAQNDLELVPTPVWARPLIALDSIGFYLMKMIAPVSLGFDYGRTPARVLNEQLFWSTGALALTTTVTAAVLAWRGRRAGLAALAIFVIAPLPVLGFLPFLYQFYSTTADHYLYVAMLGPALAVAAILNATKARAVSIAAAAVLVACGVLSFRQAATWRDSRALFTQGLNVNPDSHAAMVNLARLLPPTDPAVVPMLQRAVEISPKNIAAFNSLRTAQIEQNQPESALKTLQQEVKLKRTLPYAATARWRNDPMFWAELLLARGHVELALREADRLASERPDDPNRERLVRLARSLADASPRTPSTAPAH